MTSVYIICLSLGYAFVGAVIGAWFGEREGGDYNFMPLFTIPVGAFIGLLIGVIINAIVFT